MILSSCFTGRIPPDKAPDVAAAYAVSNRLEKKFVPVYITIFGIQGSENAAGGKIYTLSG